MTREETAMMSRRRILGMGVGGGAVAAGALLASGVTGSIAEAAGRLNFTIEGVVDLGGWRGVTFDFDGIPAHTPSTSRESGPFYVEGALYPEGSLDATGNPGDADAIGIFRAWGFFLGGDIGVDPRFSMSTTEVELFGRGTIHTQGRSAGPNDGDMGVRVVLGGTGEFAGTRGETVGQRIGPGSAFRSTFSLRA